MHSESIQLPAFKPKILVVEDNPLVMDVLKALLLNENYEVYAHENGQEALSNLKNLEADLILCDVMMPVMDGFALQAKLREQDQYAKIPFVFLTALSDTENILKGNSSGADAYLLKPFNPQELLAIIKGKIERSRQIHNVYKKQQEKFSSQVIRQISHEFRTPLVAVTTGSELLLNQQTGLANDKINSLISTIWRGGQRLEKMVNNFILLQQIQAGLANKNYQTHAEELNLVEFMKEYLAKNQAYFIEQKVKVSFDFEVDGNFWTIAHSVHLSLILDRLIDNAIKFSQDPRNINLALIEGERSVALEVKDNGNGFDRSAFKNLTQTFYQHQREINEQQGSGLGLVICKFLIRINKGRIKFRNNQQGGGDVTVLLNKLP